MRRNVFLFKASYPFLLLLFISCSAAQLSFSQQLLSDNNNDEQAYLYNWCSYLRDSNNLALNLPLLKINSEIIIPGPCNFHTDSGIVVGNIPLKSGDSLAVLISDPDSAEVKDMTIANQSIPGPAAVIDPPPAYVHNTSKQAMDISGALFDEETDMLISKYAEMISVAPDEVNNFHLYKFIDQWYGVRYKWGGNDNTGIDCSGFSQKLYNSIYNLNILRTAKQQHRSCEVFKDYGEANEGDLIFFRIHHLGISHVGVYLANGFFVHATRSRGVMISSLDEKYWRRRYAGCGRVEREDLSGTESGLLQ